MWQDWHIAQSEACSADGAFVHLLLHSATLHLCVGEPPLALACVPYRRGGLLPRCSLLQMPHYSSGACAAIAFVAQHVARQRQQVVETVPHLLGCALLPCCFPHSFAASVKRLRPFWHRFPWYVVIGSF
jgi:hypothetical protein